MSIKTGKMEQDKIHILIDDGIDDILIKEKTTKSNKEIVGKRIDKILFIYRGKMLLEKCLKGRNDIHKSGS